jgi:Ca-activated chloride channel family protein
VTRFASSGGLGLAAIAAAAFATGAAEQTPRFTAGAEVVLVDVLVTRGARPVPDLTAADFTILDSGVEQNAALVGIDRLPVSLLLALDTSASVRGAALDHLKAAARAALGSLRAADEAALVTFAHQVALGAPWTTDRARLTQAIDAAAAQGSTALSDAAFAALGLRPNGRSRTLVLLFTDGDDTASKVRFSDVLARARDEEVMIYGIGLSVNYFNGVRQIRSRPDRSLRRVAEETGGGSFEMEKTDMLASTFTRVAQELRSQYLLAFAPEGLDGKVHKLDVRVKRPGVTVRARRSYLAAVEAPSAAVQAEHR